MGLCQITADLDYVVDARATDKSSGALKMQDMKMPIATYENAKRGSDGPCSKT